MMNLALNYTMHCDVTKWAPSSCSFSSLSVEATKVSIIGYELVCADAVLLLFNANQIEVGTWR